MKEQIINWLIQVLNVETNKISDGYHTFGEMYQHRIMLFVALARKLPGQAWKSKYHKDKTFYKDWFIAGINTKHGEQISYHLGMEYWDLLDVKILDTAPVWDGHTPNDVLDRLKELK